jgi:hypothetical protein
MQVRSRAVSAVQLSPLEWLAGADPEPEHAFNWWLRHPGEIAMLPTGQLFDIVKTARTAGYRALAALDRAGGAQGPVFGNLDEDVVYFLVPVGTAATWALEGTEGLGEGTWLWVPAPTRTKGSAYWLRPPDGSGELHDPVALHAALSAAMSGATS